LSVPNVKAEKPPTRVKANGETLITMVSGKWNARVKISSHEVQIGKPSDKRPEVIRTNCTYSRYPCSIVDFIDITVNGKTIIVPRSAFCDLADLNTAEVQMKGYHLVLMLTGGDASEFYNVEIAFDSEGVTRRVMSSDDEPLQETFYHNVIIGD
jgi:hypothetical protein